MKKLLFTAPLLFALATSCVVDQDEMTIDNCNQIRLKASVESVTTRVTGPITSGFSTDIPIGIYAYKGDWAATNLINNDAATVLGAAGHAITFASGPYYYPSDGSTVHFYAFTPRGTETTAPSAGTSPVITIPITGKEDIIWASGTGYKNGSNPSVNPTLAFGHKLTQLQFKFVAGTNYPTNNLVTSLIVNAQPTSAILNVGAGTCTFSGSAAMQALSSANQSSGIAISSAGTNANSPVMTSTASSYALDITVKQGSGAADITYTAIPVSLTTSAGSAHLITLTFNETAISATATVADWITGSSVNVPVN